MRQIFKIFFTAESTRPWAVLLCLLLGGLAEAIGIGTLLPVINTSLGGASNSPLDALVRQAFGWAGVTVSFGNLLLFAVSVIVLRSALLFSAMSYAGITAARVSNGFRKRVIKAVMEARWSYYANQSGGTMATTLSNDCSRAADAYMAFATLAASALQVLAYVTIALLINWRVAVFGLLGGAVVVIASRKLVNISKSSGYKLVQRISAVSSDSVDMLQNIKALKSMHRYGALLAHLDETLRRLKRNLIAQNLARFGLMYGNDALVALIAGAGAWAAYALAGIPVSELLVSGLLFFQVVNYASKVQRQLQAAAMYEGNYVNVTRVLEDAQSQQEVNTGTLPPPQPATVHLDNISFAHGDKTILDNLSITLPHNQITVIQGPSGAGKTTVLDILAGLHQPQAGRVLVNDTDLRNIDLRLWRGGIGYVPQELVLFHDSVRNNITLFDNSIPENALQHALDLSGVSRFVNQLPKGLETDVGEFGSKLSGGQRQRISLARALVNAPRLLVLDEVTSALDPDTEDAIVNNIDELRGHYTIVAITHRPAWTRIADRLYTLEAGVATLHKIPNGKRK